MKILFVLEHYHPHIGGVEKMFRSLAESLVIDAHTVRVVTTRFDPQLPKREVVGGVEIVRLGTGNRFGFTFFSAGRVRRLAKGFDLIHTTSYNAAVPGFFAARACRIPVLITFHEVWGKLWKTLPFLQGWQRLGYRLYEQMILKFRYDHLVGVSDFTHRALLQQGFEPDQVSRIYNGLETGQMPAENHRPPETFTFTYFGRLGVSKGLDVLLEAAALFRQKHPDFQLRLILPTRPAAFLRTIKELIAKLGLDDQITLSHELPEEELWETLQQSSCVVIPSYSEGFCFTAAEACALGIPVIHSNRGALPEVVSGKHLVFEPFSSEGLSAAMELAFHGSWEESAPKRFDLKENAEQYVRLYKQLLER